MPQYSPILAIEGNGSFAVEPFRYLPFEEGRTGNDELAVQGETIHIKVPGTVGVYITDVFKKEAKLAGYKITSDSDMVITGTSIEYSFSQGTPQYFFAEIEFIIFENRRIIYSKKHSGRIATQGAYGPSNASQIALSKAIESFLTDIRSAGLIEQKQTSS